jgi:Glycosyltransferase family 87
VAALALTAPAHAAGPPPSRLVVPVRSDVPPFGWRLSARQAIAVAAAVPKIRAAAAGAQPHAYENGPRRWRVAFFRRGEVAQVSIDDRTGRVIEAWTGPQVHWFLARGYPGYIGRAANAPWIWIGLGALFVLPFARRPLRWLHLDLAVLLAFGLSYAALGAADLDVSVPTVYPLLGYLLARMLWVAARGRTPAPTLLSPAVLWRITAGLVAFRVALNLVDGNVVDVGYAGVIGADRLTSGLPLYGAFPFDNPHGDTYGPVLYALYVPFELLFPWSGHWDHLPAAHAAAVAFDLGCVALLWALGRRLGGPRLGALLPYLWVTYPFTLLVSNSSSNDALPAALVLLALLFWERPAARGAASAAAGLTKLAQLALLPLFIGRRPAALAGAAAVAAVALGPLVWHGHLGTFWERTVGFQADRGSPFSVWGLYGGLGGLQLAVQVAAVALAVAVAFWPRRRDTATVAALAAAVLIAVQLGVDHWFYLYLPWFAPLVWIALLAQPSGRSTGSMAAARRGPEAVTSTAFSQGSSSAAS